MISFCVITTHQNKKLRGGGCGKLAKTSAGTQDHQTLQNSNYKIPDVVLILNEYLEMLDNNLLKIGSPKVQEDIMKNTQLVIMCEKYFHLITMKNDKKVQETVNLANEGLLKLISMLPQIIRSQKFLSYQILKICNFFSQVIFIYFIKNPKPPFEQEKQKSLQQYIEQIREIQEADGEIQPYSNQISYELELISGCVDTIPTNSTEGREIGIKIFQEIISSVVTMSPSTELFSALAQGAIFLYKENKKANQKEMFKLCFLLEQTKWQIVLQVEKQGDVNNLLTYLKDTYSKIIQNSSIWQVKYCWIKILSDLLSAQPLVTKQQFINLQEELKVNETWKQLIQQSIIKPIGSDCVFGILTSIKSNSKVALALQQQFYDYDFLQDQVMNGFLEVPPFEFYYKFNSVKKQNTEDQANQDKYIEFIQQINTLPFQQINQYFEEITNNFTKYYKQKQNLIIRLQQQYQSKEYFDNQVPILSQNITNLIFKMSQYVPILSFSKHVALQLQQLLIEIKEDETYSNLLKINQLLFIFEEGQQFCRTEELNKLLIQNLHTSNIIQSNRKWQKENFRFFEKKIEKPQNIIAQLKQLKKETLQYFDGLAWNQQLNSILNFIVTQHIDSILINSITSNLTQEYLNFADFKIMSYQKQEFLKQENQNIIQLILEFSNAQMLKICFSDLNEQLIVKQIKINDYLQFMKQINCIFKVYPCIDNNMNKNNFLQTSQFNSTESIAPGEKKSLLQFFRQNIQDSEERLLKIYNLALQCSQITRTGQKKQKETNPARDVLQEITQELLTIRNSSDFNNDFKDQNSQFEQLQYQLKKLVQLCGKEQDLFRDSQLQNKANQVLFFIHEINNKQDLTKIIQLDINSIIKNQVTQITSQIQESFQKENQEEKEIGSNNQNTIFSNMKNISTEIYQSYQQYNEQKLKWEKLINSIVAIDELQFTLFQLQQQRNPNLSQHFRKEIIEFKETLSCQFVNDSKVLKEFQQLQGEFQEQKCELNEKYDFQNVHAIEFLIKVENEQKIDLKLDENKVSWLSTLEGDDWHIRESFIFHSINIQPLLKQINHDKISKQLIICKATETDIRVKATFKNAETLQVMNNVIGKYWDEMENSIQQQIDDKLKRLRAIQLQLQSIEKEEERALLLQEYKDIEEQIQNQSENVKEIGDALGFTIGFLKNIKKDLETLEQQLDKVLKNIEQVGQDIKFLRGKSPQQMFEIRMQQVLQNKLINDANSVYVQLLTNEMDFSRKTLVNESTPLFNWEGRKDGEVDEFLFQDKKDSLLIHGVAGSGKSLAAQKIEEYMWIQYQQKTKLQKWQASQSIIPIIPIFIQLPTLKDPKYSAVEETLKSQQYRLDEKQINEFKEQVQEGIIKIIFIMDSYDELPSEYQTININITNKLKLWKSQGQISIYPKVITTSRTEAFVKKEYQEWFCCDEKLNLDSFKEIRIRPFDIDQQNSFLIQFSKMKIKNHIIDLYELICKKDSKKKEMVFVIQNVWNKIIKNCFGQSFENIQLLSDEEVGYIIKTIKEDPQIVDLNKEQESSFRKQLAETWSLSRFNECITQMELGKLLETPFMMNIVVEVLPNIYFQVSQPNYLKPYFINSFIKMKEKEQVAKYNKEYFHNFWIDQNPKFAYPLDLPEKLDDDSLSRIKTEATNFWEQLVSSNFFNRFDSSQSKTLLKENLIKKMGFEEQIAGKLANCLQSYKLLVYDFYQQFFNQYVEQQIRKLQMNLENINFSTFFKDVEAFSIRLSTLFMNNQETGVEYHQKGIINKMTTIDNYYELFDENDQHARYKQLIKKCVPLKIKGNYISFIHKSIQEFLFAKYNIQILKQIHHVRTTIDQILIQSALNQKFGTLEELNDRFKSSEFQENEKFKQIKQRHLKIEQIKELFTYIYTSAINEIIWSDHFYLGAIKFLAKLVENDTQLFQSVLFLVKLSAYCVQFINTSSNALQLLAFTKRSLTGQNFKGILIKDIQLIGVDFRGCDLSETSFENVNMTGMNLNFTNLNGAQWTNMTTHDLPVLKGHQDAVKCIIVSPDSKIIISGGDLLIMWDAQTGNQIGEPINQHNKSIKALSLSADGNKVASADSDEWILWSFFGQKLEIIKKFQSNDIYSLCFSFESKFLFQGGQTNIIVWNLLTQKQACDPLNGHNSKINQIVYASNGLFFASASNDSFIIIWNVEKMQSDGILKHDHNVMSLAVSSNCKMIVGSTYNDQIVLWDYATRQKVYTMRGHKYRIPTVAFSPDDRIIVSGGTDNTIRLWDSFTGKQIGEQLFGHSSDVNQVLFSPNGYTIISSSSDKTVRIWDAMSRTQFGDPLNGHRGYIQCSEYSKDGRLIASGGYDGQACIWDAQSGKMVIDSFQCNSSIRSISFSNNSNYLCCGLESDKVVVFSIEDCKKAGQFDKHKGEILSTFFTICDEDIISGGNDKKIYRWNKITQEIKFQITTQQKIRIMSYSKKGQQFASGEEGECCIWDAQDGKKLMKLELDPPEIIDGLSFSYDDQFLALGLFDYSVRIFSTINGQQIKSILGHNDCVESVKVTNNQKCLISGCYDSTIKFWKLKTLEETSETLTSHNSWIYNLDTSPDGFHFLSCSADSSLRVWDISEGPQILDHLQMNANWILCMTYSIDGQFIYTGGKDGNAGQWNLMHGNLIRLFDAKHKNGVIALANSSENNYLATAGEDGKIFIWNIKNGNKIYELMSDELGKIVCLTIGQESHLSIAGDNHTIITIWQFESQISLKHKLEVNQKGVYLMKFLQNNQLILTCIKQEGITIWNCQNNDQIVFYKLADHIQYITLSKDEHILRCLIKHNKSFRYFNIHEQQEGELNEVDSDEFQDRFLDEKQLIELYSISLMPASKTKTHYAYLNHETSVISRTGHNLAKIWFKGQN